MEGKAEQGETDVEERMVLVGLDRGDVLVEGDNALLASWTLVDLKRGWSVKLKWNNDRRGAGDRK